jgi:hypothetical protein
VDGHVGFDDFKEKDWENYIRFRQTPQRVTPSIYGGVRKPGPRTDSELILTLL